MEVEKAGREPVSRSRRTPDVDFDGVRRFRYLPQLDGMRALAVASVLAAHAEISLTPGGGIGVDVFFVLSGYLITSLLLQEFDATGTLSLRTFYVRRARRLLPALLAVAAISFVAFSVVRPTDTDDTLVGVLASVLYVSCWYRALGFSDLGWFGHTWSLSVEEHFYLLWPPLLLLLLRRGLTHLRRWVLVLLGVAMLYRMGSAVVGVSPARMNGPDMRAGQLLAGCALAVVMMGGTWAVRARRWDRLWAVLLVLSIADIARVVTFPYAFGLRWAQYVSTEFVALEAAVIISYVVVHAGSALTRGLSHPALVWVGRRSYAIYLWHLPLFGLFSLTGERTPVRVAGRAAAVVLTFVAAWASFRWVESPFYRRRVEGAADVEGSPSDRDVVGPPVLAPKPT